MCLFLVTLFGGPRIGGLLWWLFYPNRWESAFDNVLYPVFGLILVPWTTIMFVAVAPFGNVDGFDWVWLGLAFFVDLMSLGGSGYERSRSYASAA